MKNHFLLFFITIPLYSAHLNTTQKNLHDLTNTLGALENALKTMVPSEKPKSPTEDFHFAYKTFNEWHADCMKLPYYRTVGENYSHKPPLFDAAEAEKALMAFKTTLEKSILVKKECWVDQKASPDVSFFDFSPKRLKPYVQKLVVPIGTQTAFHGDLHGDIHSLCEYLKELSSRGYLDPNDPFKITKENFYMVFLGDYVDRGNYGIEVIYTILRLKIANPENVFMVRGNHEDIHINNNYGFTDELQEKFPNDKKLYDKIYGLYNLLPVALYYGSGDPAALTFFQCCHGGMELGYLPENLLITKESVAFQWLGALQRPENLKTIIHNKYRGLAKEQAEIELSLTEAIQKVVPEQIEKLDSGDYAANNIGFMWNDFVVQPSTYIHESSRGHTIAEYGESLTNLILEGSISNMHNHKIKGVFRAHQHSREFTNPRGQPTMMSVILDASYPESLGVGKLWRTTEFAKKKDVELWDNIVCTFNVSPDTAYSKSDGSYTGFNFDTYAIVKTGKNYPHDWSFKVYRKAILK